MLIRTKLYLSYGVLIAAIILMSIYGIVQIFNVDDMSSKIVANNIPRISTMTRVDVDISDYRGYAYAHVIAQDRKTQQEYEQKMAETKKTIDANLTKYKEMSTQKDKVTKLEGEWSDFAAKVDQLIVASRSNDTVKAMEYSA